MPAKLSADAAKLGLAPKRRHKYRVAPKEERTVEGIVFASKREAKRWVELKKLKASGLIAHLHTQVKYDLRVGNVLIESYVADFVYFEVEDGELTREVVEDCKGYRTRDYKRKRRWMKLVHDITIKET